MTCINDDDFKVLERHGLTLRFEEKKKILSSSSPEKKKKENGEEKEKNVSKQTLHASYSMNPDDVFTRHLNRGMVTTEFQSSDASDLSDVAFSLSATNSHRGLGGQKSTDERNTSLSRMSNSSTAAAYADDNNTEDLNRQLAAAHQRLNMLEKMLTADDHYHETVNILSGYQKQLAQLHEEATGCGAGGGGNTVGYHTPVSVARAKERLASRKMSAAYTRRTADIDNTILCVLAIQHYYILVAQLQHQEILTYNYSTKKK